MKKTGGFLTTIENKILLRKKHHELSLTKDDEYYHGSSVLPLKTDFI